MRRGNHSKSFPISAILLSSNFCIYVLAVVCGLSKYSIAPPIGFGWALWKSSTGKDAVLVSKGKEEIGLGQNGRDLIV